MKALNKTLVAAMISASLVGCSSTPDPVEQAAEVKKEKIEQKIEARNAMLESVPEWFFEHKASDTGFFASGSYYSTDMADAVRQAKNDAKVELATFYQEFVSKEVKNSTRSGANFNDRRLTVVDMFVPEIDISDSRTVETKLVPEKTGFRAYVLMMVPKESVVNFKTQQEEDFVDSILEMQHKKLVDRVQQYKDAKHSKQVELAKAVSTGDKE